MGSYKSARSNFLFLRRETKILKNIWAIVKKYEAYKSHLPNNIFKISMTKIVICYKDAIIRWTVDDFCINFSQKS